MVDIVTIVGVCSGCDWLSRLSMVRIKFFLKNMWNLVIYSGGGLTMLLLPNLLIKCCLFMNSQLWKSFVFFGCLFTNKGCLPTVIG